jgi:hypothetical protein
MDWRMFVESWIIIICGVLLLSPVFNSVFVIPIISLIESIPQLLIGHLAFALVPIIIVCLIELIQGHD